MDVKVTVQDLLNAFDSIQRIGAVQTDSRRALKIAQNERGLLMEAQVITARRDATIKEFGGVELIPIGNGRSAYVPYPEGWDKTLGAENSEELMAQQKELSDKFEEIMKELNEAEVEVTLRGLNPAKDLPDNGLIGNDLARCWFLIENFATFEFPEETEEDAKPATRVKPRK